ncbi:MAG TPA: glutaredoxin, partial [Sphingomonas sp.]|nr:glutaredoxin [Sphingomonas sp.]
MTANAKRAVLYRMVMADHFCPWGLRAFDLLRRKGFEVEDRHLTTRGEVDAFKATHGVSTTPQVFIDGARVGGYDDLRRHFGLKVRDPKAPTYTPVIALFGMAAAMALAASQAATGTPFTLQALIWFVAFAMCLLALMKLRDVASFSTMFLGYDLLAKRWLPYATIYPFAEGLAGVLMAAGVLTWFAAPLALFIGSVGAVSVFKAVYVDRR